MSSNYKRFKRARISDRKIREILRLFAVDLTATQIAALTRLNRNTVNRYLKLIREAIAAFCKSESPFSGEVELDECYFGPKRIPGKHGRGAARKTLVFGIYKRNGSVYTEIVPNCSKQTLFAIIRGKVTLDSTVHTDGMRTYDSIVDMGYQKHYRVYHNRDEFVVGSSHINGIEGFWGLAKVRLAKFRGMRPETFYLHLKECEFRFNYRKQNLYPILLKIVKDF
ncbi:MAG: IS1595 family transposase [Acidobacteriota bacterium]|nr:MAG: IS1595 family transposase [Acidobacteriota bacterium]QQS40155.1 MAG: IS1595 family transposase [Acidobacteriota bacterium]QQS42207.1 MAG: IS1595 family transposase [Acidobacteriota bacterium]QQS42232.1 MAG: IS1595 family transposase [Acidobacteriota bacterium]QQS42395.1 MAG: IS1595 family transposase [Acidobacteriota bacterium]